MSRFGTDSKADVAERLINDGGSISVQTLNELTNVARRKLLLGWPQIDLLIDKVVGLLHVVPITESVHRRGRTFAQRYNLSVYDAMIVAAAIEAGCETLYSEDMQDGLVVAGRLTIRNPFLTAA